MKHINIILSLVIQLLLTSCSSLEQPKKVPLTLNSNYSLTRIDTQNVKADSNASIVLIQQGEHELTFQLNSNSQLPHYAPKEVKIMNYYEADRQYEVFIASNSSYEEDNPWIKLFIAETF